MLWLPFIGLIIGFQVMWLPLRLPPDYAPYLSLATLAGFDSICGGIRAGIEGKFHDDIFISGFVVNTFLAAVFAYVGVLLGIDLALAAAVALCGRVFLNLSLIRRYWLTQTAMSKKREV